MSLAKPLFVLVIVAGGLAIADGVLSRAASETRAASSRVRRLVPPEKREVALVAAVEVSDTARGTKHLYGRTDGIWRCLTYRSAVANGSQVESVLKKLFEGEGIVKSKDPAQSATYGLAPPSLIRLVLHGANAVATPAGDPIFQFEVGDPAPAVNGCYVRIAGAKEIWAIDLNLREELAPPGLGALPPMLDLQAVPLAWPGMQKGIAKLVVEVGGVPPFELEGRRREISPDEMRQGKSPWEWFVVRPGGEAVAEQDLAMAYLSFFLRAPCADVVDTSDTSTHAALGLDRPRARVTVHPHEGEPLVITFGGGTAAGAIPVFDPFSRTVRALAAPLLPLAAPAAEQLLPGAPGNAWEAVLKQMQGR